MKWPLWMILFFSFRALSQDCNLQKENDPITNAPKISTGFFNLQLTTLSIDADSKNVDFFFTVDNSGKCFDYASSVVINFEGGKLKYTMRNSGTVNCEGYFHFTFRNGATTPTQLLNLSEKKVVSLKFLGTNKDETTVTLVPQQQELLMKLTACIIAESKTLLPAN
ncbi:MAG: hypothetical protein JST17_09260 [Bacteroidetes bacterium]|nr:hypothetical protein [Bacteroidota bacterium]MBS1931172.1 hypothetical protein [Bacteroidota bacterium]